MPPGLGSVPSVSGVNLEPASAAPADQTSSALTDPLDEAPIQTESVKNPAALATPPLDSSLMVAQLNPHAVVFDSSMAGWDPAQTRLAPGADNQSPTRERALDSASPRTQISSILRPPSGQSPVFLRADDRDSEPLDTATVVSESPAAIAYAATSAEDSLPGSASSPPKDGLRSGATEVIQPIGEPDAKSSANRSGSFTEGDLPSRASLASNAGQPKPQPAGAERQATEDKATETQPKNQTGPVADKDASAAREAKQGDTTRQLVESVPQPVETSELHAISNEPAETAPVLPKETNLDPAIDSAARPAIARQISLKLAGADATNVDVQVRERAGRIEVAVRAGDSELNKSLQSDLGDLVSRLENRGFKTEAWTPAAARQPVSLPSASEAGAHQQQPGHSGSGGGRQPRQGQGDSNPRRQPRETAQFDEALAEEDAKDGINQ
jgi:hypothetical protein